MKYFHVNIEVEIEVLFILSPLLKPSQEYSEVLACFKQVLFMEI